MPDSFDDRVLAICAANAVLRTKGVAQLSATLSENLSEKLGKTYDYKGIKINRAEDQSVIADINVVVNYGEKIPEIAWEIQNNVKQEIENIAETKVQAVNIHIQGVAFDSEKD